MKNEHYWFVHCCFNLIVVLFILLIIIRAVIFY
ncbi:YjcZ family sporulation protein [Bacillus sp. MUM 116]